MSLNKQIWTDQITKNFYVDASFLKYAKDFTALVNYDKINMADCGFDPAVLINNTTYPIAIANRDDTPLEFNLDLFETENTKVSNPEAMELSYDKMESVLSGHRSALRQKTALKAAHAYAPTSDSTYTPVITTTGEDNGEGYKRLTIKDVLRLKRRYDAVDAPLDTRFLVLEPRHVEDLILEDTKSFKDITDVVNGQPKRFASFNILTFSKPASYVVATGIKKPFGSVFSGADTFSSFSFCSDEVMKADGSVNMYERLNDPELRATVVGFDKRFIAMPIRNKLNGAILAGKV